MTEEKQALDPSSKKAKTTIWGTVDSALVGGKIMAEVLLDWA